MLAVSFSKGLARDQPELLSGGSCDWLLRFPDSAASAAAQASAAAPTAARAARAACSASGSASAARLRATCAAPGLVPPHVLRRSYGDAVSALHGSRGRVKFGARRFSVPYTKDLLTKNIDKVHLTVSRASILKNVAP